jgi:hypothetical protein
MVKKSCFYGFEKYFIYDNDIRYHSTVMRFRPQFKIILNILCIYEIVNNINSITVALT